MYGMGQLLSAICTPILQSLGTTPHFTTPMKPKQPILTICQRSKAKLNSYPLHHGRFSACPPGPI